MQEWNWEKNNTEQVYPTKISRGYNKKVWWKCQNGHEWKATVACRTGEQKCGCPYCAGQKVLSGENDLETLYPNIAQDWDYSKNLKKPSEVRPMSNKKYWWICPKCGKSYQASASHRVGRGSSCPDC